MAIDCDNSCAMNKLATYYHDIKENYVEAIKYYEMAIDCGNSYDMNDLADYYYNIEAIYVETH